MSECISGQQESLRRILSPASSLDTQSANLVNIKVFFFPYYPLTVFCLVFQMARLADNTFDSRGIAFSLKPYQNATVIKGTESLQEYLQYGHTERATLFISEHHPAKVKSQRKY